MAVLSCRVIALAAAARALPIIVAVTTVRLTMRPDLVLMSSAEQAHSLLVESLSLTEF
jgi:hypothetical protein